MNSDTLLSSKAYACLGCPCYVLEPTLQDGHKLAKWKPCSCSTIFVGFSPFHSSLVPLVLNTCSGNSDLNSMSSLMTGLPASSQWAWMMLSILLNDRNYLPLHVFNTPLMKMIPCILGPNGPLMSQIISAITSTMFVLTLVI